MKKLIKILTALIPNKRWRHYLRQYFSDGGPGGGASSGKMRLYYCTEQNFGDMLNRNLMQYFNCPYTFSHAMFADLCCIGSMMEGLLLTDKQGCTRRPIHVYGTGFIKAPEQSDEQFNRPVIIHALRGKKSLERCEQILKKKLPDVVLGDPGLLIRRIFPNTGNKKIYDVGLICHIADTPQELHKHLNFTPAIKTTQLDITLPPEEFVARLSECKFILSSAMHGLICADSLGIPNAHIILSDKVIGNEYKYRDYYSVFSHAEYTPIYLNHTTLSDNDIPRLTEKYHISSEEIDMICDRLIQAFPTLTPTELSCSSSFQPSRSQQPNSGKTTFLHCR